MYYGLCYSKLIDFLVFFMRISFLFIIILLGNLKALTTSYVYLTSLCYTVCQIWGAYSSQYLWMGQLFS